VENTLIMRERKDRARVKKFNTDVVA